MSQENYQPIRTPHPSRRTNPYPPLSRSRDNDRSTSFSPGPIGSFSQAPLGVQNLLNVNQGRDFAYSLQNDTPDSGSCYGQNSHYDNGLFSREGVDSGVPASRQSLATTAVQIVASLADHAKLNDNRRMLAHEFNTVGSIYKQCCRTALVLMHPYFASHRSIAALRWQCSTCKDLRLTNRSKKREIS
jgi:hypothetical protein